jgi:hypothetical protein
MKIFYNLAFQIYLLKGSFVNDNIYKSFTNQLSQSLNKTIEIKEAQLFERNTYNKDTILIGHSFGGYLALLDYFKNKDKIKGIVLINSHFNTNKKAIYPSLNQESFSIPILTIIGGKDNKLPIDISFDDFQHQQKWYLKDKYYYIDKNIDHYNIFTNYKITKNNVNLITEFIKSIKNKEFNYFENKIKENNKEYIWNKFEICKFKKNFSNSFNILDAFFNLIIGDLLWNLIHFNLFLLHKPIYNDGLFINQKNIYLKTNHKNESTIINDYEKVNKIIKNYDYEIKNLGIIYPYSISKWLFCNPKIKKDSYEIYKISLPFNMTYYKFPNPNYLIIDYLKN